MTNDDNKYSYYSVASGWGTYRCLCADCQKGYLFKWCPICENKWVTKHTCLFASKAKDWLDVMRTLK